MKRITFLAASIAGFFLFGAQSAFADDCANLGGNISGGECVIDGTPPGTPPNNRSGAVAFVLDETLHLKAPGIITVPPTSPANTLTININNNGGLIMDAGTAINGDSTGATGLGAFITINATGTGDFFLAGTSGATPGAMITAQQFGGQCSGGHGGKITLTSNGGDITTENGSLISVGQFGLGSGTNCPAGEIVITTSGAGLVDIDGSVLSQSNNTGNGRAGGGPITIVGGCTVTVSDTGVVSSKGKDPGADLVHVEGCTVFIYGLVESTGPGHAGHPNEPNKCNLEPLAHPLPALDSAGYNACVEIWSGTTVVIDSLNHNGQVNADTGQSGGPEGRGWIDVYANGDISIIGDTDVLTPFAVHSNGGIGVNTDDGGLITIKALGLVPAGGPPPTPGSGNVSASDRAIQADSTSAGGKGGEIHVEAFTNVNFNSGVIFARGTLSGAGASHGGFIGTNGVTPAPIRAWNGALTWTSGIGDVRPVGNGVGAGQQGVINLEACTNPIALGVTLFPTNGAAIPPFPKTSFACGGGPVKNTLGSLPFGTCFQTACTTSQSKSGMKFLDANQNHKNDGLPSEPGLANWTIKAFNSVTNAFVNSAVTDGLGHYDIPLDPGSYKVCEVQKPGFTQTCPQGSPLNLDCNLAATTTVDDCSTIPGGGVTGVGYLITIQAGINDTGNDFGNFRPTNCPEDPKAVLTRSVGNPNSGVIDYPTLQAAYDDASDTGETIGMFSKTVENVVLGGAKTMKITQCTSARITAADNSLPVWNITSTGKLTIVGPDSVGGTNGWLIANLSGGPHTLKSVRANGASVWGIRINSDGNNVSWNDVSGNGNGATGGILVVGKSNTLKGGTTGPNNGDGVKITGDKNSLSGATVNGNTGNGVTTGNGVIVTGSNNVIKGNSASSNTLDGFNNAGSGNNYSGNSSNKGSSGSSTENGGAEYRFLTAGVNGGSNRADGINVPKTSVPQKCPTFPAVSVCE